MRGPVARVAREAFWSGYPNEILASISWGELPAPCALGDRGIGLGRDLAVPQVYVTLLDEGRYVCSPRTMYRILDAQGEVRERRDQLSCAHMEDPSGRFSAPDA